ncbi:protein FAM151A-like isoform X1 [Acipenser oxyrinchus oxyrinchus]|uniref:Protein FAM151A n=1 Tax=Acipenser oxyrinchus oxyrinchus TaxID=40147 RepID=A0AAD8DAL7_ACIOX|nr:protein FAM151A-like isoform X1 [Acipenser oxyrinchus oxyrinchus]
MSKHREIEKKVVEKKERCISREECTMAAVGIFVALVLVVSTIFSMNRSFSPDHVTFPTDGDMQDYLLDLSLIQKKDGLLVSWYHSANNKSEMEKALKSDAMVLEADVNIEGYNTDGQTSIPIMAHPPDIYSDNTLQEWLDAVLKSNKGIKLDFKTIESVGPSLDILKKKALESGINRPVWLNADILHGPNVPGFIEVVNATSFLNLIQEKFPNATISPGWKVLYVSLLPNKTYTRAMVKDMYKLLKNVTQKVTFPIRAVMGKNAWPHFKWLLEQSPSYSLMLWQGKDDPVTVEDLLFIRDNSQPDQIYYDIYDPALSAFKEVAFQPNRSRRFYSGGSLIDYFKPRNSDGIYIQWHSIDNRITLMTLLKEGDSGMIVVPVGEAQSNPGVPAVDGSDTDFQLQECLHLILVSPKPWGIYLKIKSQELLSPALALLKHLNEKKLLYNPTWINMDVSYGRFATPGYIGGDQFIKEINKVFPYVTIAPGWPKELLVQGYTKPLVEDMMSLCKGLWQEVSYQLQAVPLGKSLLAIQMLQQSSPRHSLTVEHQLEQGSYMTGYKGLILVRGRNTDKVFYNLHKDYSNNFARDVFTS